MTLRGFNTRIYSAYYNVTHVLNEPERTNFFYRAAKMKQRTKFSWACVVALGALVLTVSGVSAQDKMKALLVDGQNNHGNWPQTSQMMKSYLESSGLFEVEIARTAKKGTDPNFAPKFSDFDVVVSYYNGAAWPKETQKTF